MQRWIVMACVVLALLMGGGVFAVWKIRQSRPDFSYVPLPFNPESSAEQREQTVKEMRGKLLTDTILTGVVRDCDIERKWNHPSEQAAVEDLRRRAIFEAGETDLGKGMKVPTLNIGFRGKKGEHEDLEALAKRMMADVQRVVAPAKESDSGSMPAKF